MIDYIEKLNYPVKCWWLSFIVGIVFIVASAGLYLHPVVSIPGLCMVFGICLLTSAVNEIVFSIRNRDNISSWRWSLSGGLVDFLIGVTFIIDPYMREEALPYLLFTWFVYRGFAGLSIAFDIRQYGVYRWMWILVVSLFVILLSLGIILEQTIALENLVWLIASALLILGVYKIFYSFELKSLHKRFDEFMEKRNRLNEMY